MALSLNLTVASLFHANPSEGLQGEATLEQDIRFVVIHLPGPNWIGGQPIFAQRGLQAHIDHYWQQLAAGKLMAEGPFWEDAGGGMMIPQPGLSEDQIAAFAQEDPAVASGLLTFEVCL